MVKKSRDQYPTRFQPVKGTEIVAGLKTGARPMPASLALGGLLGEAETAFIISFTNTRGYRVSRKCSYSSPAAAMRDYQAVLERIVTANALFRPVEITRPGLILALGMVRFRPDAAWARRRDADTCRALSDTLRCCNLERAEGRRVVAVSKDTAAHGDMVDRASHVDGWFGEALADAMAVDGAPLRGTAAVATVVVDWNRFPPQYARDAYPQALAMIARLRANGALAEGCVVHLPLLQDQQVGWPLAYDAFGAPIDYHWPTRGVGVDENPLWRATMQLWPTYSVKANAGFLYRQSPFVVFDL